VNVNEQELSPGDQARITETPSLSITATANSELVLIDLP
jgi:hypothetical protein